MSYIFFIFIVLLYLFNLLINVRRIAVKTVDIECSSSEKQQPQVVVRSWLGPSGRVSELIPHGVSNIFVETCKLSVTFVWIYLVSWFALHFLCFYTYLCGVDILYLFKVFLLQWLWEKSHDTALGKYTIIIIHWLWESASCNDQDERLLQHPGDFQLFLCSGVSQMFPGELANTL